MQVFRARLSNSYTPKMQEAVRVFVRSLAIALMLLSSGSNSEEGFKPLFNGQNLSGWVPVNVAPSTFSVRDGMIVSTGIPTGVMRTKKMYENFILELEWRHMKPGGNAGLFVWSDAITSPGVPFTRSTEVQIIDGNHPEGLWTGHGDLFPIHGATFVPDRPHPQGWMRCLPSERRANPAGQWNHYRVECRDGRLTLAVNGKVVSGGSKTSPRKGYICLESEGSECHFRNLRIQEMPSSNPPPDEISTADLGYSSLYTGIDLSGWKVEGVHGNHWQAKDWTLVADGKAEPAGQRLSTTREFGDAAFIVDYRFERRPDGEFLPVLVRGKPIPVPGGPGAADKWHRAKMVLRGGAVTISVDDQVVINNGMLVGIPANGPLTLLAESGPIQFGNIYVMEFMAAARHSNAPHGISIYD